jgi:hypothetical protein
MLGVFIHQEGHASRWQDADDVRKKSARVSQDASMERREEEAAAPPPVDDRYSPLVESDPALLLPDLADNVGGRVVDGTSTNLLKADPHNLIRVGGSTGKHLGGSREEKVIHIAKLFLAVVATPMLQLLVGRELDGSVGNAEQGRDQTTIEAPNTLFGPDVLRAMGNALVSARSTATSRQHTRLDDPDGVGRDSRENTYAGQSDARQQQ